MTVALLHDAVDPDRFGGKAAQLAAAIRHGLAVPPGVAVTADTAGRVARGQAHAGRALQDLVADLPADGFAVRSSAPGEDSRAASHAGQYTTRLNVGRDRVLEAVAQVWHSGGQRRAAAYRRRAGLEPSTAGIGVVVQVLVPAVVAGVLFTRDPVTGAPQRVIEASWGFGDTVVTGTVVPDRWRLAPDGTVLACEVGIKDRMVTIDAGGGTSTRAVGPQAARTACLDTQHLRALAALADGCEELFGGARDLEWAFAVGRLWLLQARPVTVGR